MNNCRYALHPGYLWQNTQTGRVYSILFLAMSTTKASACSRVVIYERGSERFACDAGEFLAQFEFVSSGPVLVPVKEGIVKD